MAKVHKQSLPATYFSLLFDMPIEGVCKSRLPLWGTGGGFGRAVLEYTELLAGKRADNVYQASFSRSECVVQKREMSRGTGGD